MSILFVYNNLLQMAQALRNLVNKSRRRIAAVYSGVDRMLKSSVKKKAQQQRNQDEDSHQNTESVVEAVQEKMRSEGLSECDTQQLDHTEEQYKE